MKIEDLAESSLVDLSLGGTNCLHFQDSHQNGRCGAVQFGGYVSQFR
jgi:hypothetical protein